MRLPFPAADRDSADPRSDSSQDQTAGESSSAPAEQSSTPLPSLSLPRGGGAIRGIGEKFAANPVNGTGSMSVPIATTPGRSDFGPQLSLSYDSGASNSPFGFGWSLSLPQISRKTDKGLPQYRDAEESDVFLLSGAEDLVPVLADDGMLFTDDASVADYTIHRYRPRIEGLFARIERWTRQSDGDVHWRSISRDNFLTVYGKDTNSRIVDPANPQRIFAWLICETRDDKGNAVLYEYKPEDGTGIDLTQAHERNRGERDDPRRGANRYLKSIRYGNREPLLEPSTGQRPPFVAADRIDNAGWMFEVVFDYGEHDPAIPTPRDAGPWIWRDDPFSSYRSGFEVRTGRLCQRVLMFHHFPGEAGVGDDCLVRSTDFTYSHEQDPTDARNPVYTFLRAVTHSGYRRHDDGYLRSSLPTVEFEYSKPVVQDAVEKVDPDSLENLPIGVDGAAYRWFDLHGEGIPGILSEQADAWFYKRNVSPIGERTVDLAPQELVAAKPQVTLAEGAQLMDLAGDGRPDVVVLDGPTPGFYEHDGAAGWQPFRAFTSRLQRDTGDPNLRFVDLDGDGRTDVLISEDDVFVWHPSLAEDGFGPSHRVQQALDEEKGPRLIFAEGTQSIFLADLSGDGLTDLVRIRNGEVCYWPNLGYGRFGAKVAMDRGPRFDHPDHFEPRRIRLADIDGSGTTDIIYLHRDGVCLYFNQSGNSWSAPQVLNAFPQVDDLVNIVPTDLLGNGTACLVWSSPLPGDRQSSMRYVNLMGEQKPHLLTRTVNNLGAETRVEYAPSTRFYLQDRRDGRPWITRLPFPVHVVERVETLDAISGNRFVTRYAYHHGYFDGEEREFRGFGMVEQWDTEEFAALTAGGTLPEATNIEAASHVPPVLTKTWFHTGLYVGRGHVSNFFAGLLDGNDQGEYYREPAWRDDDEEASLRLLPDTVLPPGLTAEEEREACRALRGSMLRQEVYSLDGTEKAEHPYTVSEQNFTVQRLQARGTNRHGVFFSHARETINYHYERNPEDPRVQHALTLEVDAYGNVLRELAVGYGRRGPATDPALTAEDQAKQTRLLITYTENAFTSALSSVDHYRTPLPAEVQTYELNGFLPADGARFSFEEWVRDGFALLASATEIPYERTADDITREKRRIEHVRTLYRKDDLTELLPLGEIEPLALPGESYQLALTPGLLARVFQRRQEGEPDEDLLPDPAAVLEGQGADQGGYVAMDGSWWVPSGRSFFDPNADVGDPATTAPQELQNARQHFYLPRKAVDPFGQSTVVDYDDHDLLSVRTRDALGNTVTAVNDYRVLQPRLVTDPNRNRAVAAFDALGMVAATAVMGKDGEDLGDLLQEDLVADPQLADLQAFVADPLSQAPSLLETATTRIVYDLDRFARAGQPPFAATLARETHFHDSGGEATKIQISFSYSDGFGREIQRKIQAEPGEAPQRQPPVVLPNGDTGPGELLRDGSGDLVVAHTPRRWVGSGRTVFNNKGQPVKQYEPFFSATHLYEPEREMTDAGVSPVLFHDPVGRVVATLHPNHTYEKVVFDPWQQTTWDVNDTVAARGIQTGDPRTDPDIASYVRKYFMGEPASWQTWHTQRIGGQLGPAERAAAEKAAAHANTHAVAYFDALGRPFLTLAHNRYERDGTEVEERYATRVELDVEGNQREVIDAKDRVVMRYDYDLLSNRIHQASMEAGERWMLSDVAGNPIRAWDSRRFIRRMTYDELRRPTGLYVTEVGVERLAERTVYGESQGDATNHRTRVFQVFDGAGVVTSEAYDFKGNLLHSHRRLLVDYKSAVDWDTDPALEDGHPYTSRTTYDALDRPVTSTSPDGSIQRPTYNEANLLDRVEVNLRGAAEATVFVKHIDYDAKAQRLKIDYGNGVSTRFSYDLETFRLIHLRTEETGPGRLLQNLQYTFDAAGNITQVRDTAQQTTFFANARVEPSTHYTYDALFRLIEATGREHLGQVGGPPIPHSYNDAPRVGRNGIPHPNDGQTLGRYIERYFYDQVGNIEVMQHRGTNPVHPLHPEWTRTYTYNEPSQLEPAKVSNRLTRTRVGNGVSATATYSNAGAGYDTHGNMLKMPQLQIMRWNEHDQLQMTQRQAVNQTDADGAQRQGERTYYVYDAGGQRIRKVTELANGQVKDERIYLGRFEIYRKPADNLEREMLHITDDRQRIAIVEILTQGNEPGLPSELVRYQLGNHLESACLEIDDQARVLSYEEYTPYGSTAYQAVRSQIQAPKRYRFTGMERDEESGLGYHSVRYYAPWLGRWTSCDQAELLDGPNAYGFVQGNPVRLVDPNGRQGEPKDDDKKSTAVSTALKAGRPLQALDVALRDTYKAANVSRARFTQDWLKIVKPTATNADKAATAARSVSALRNILREVTQGQLTPVGRVLSKVLEKDRSWRSVVEAKGNPFDPRLTPSERMAVAEKIIKSSAKSSRAMNALHALSKGLLVLNAAASGKQVGEGINRIIEGEFAEGALDIAEGTSNFALGTGTYAAVKSGAIVTEAGVSAGVVTVGSALAAGGSLALTFEETRRVLRGEETAAAEASDHWRNVQTELTREKPSVGGALEYIGAEFGKDIANLFAGGQEDLWGLLR